jgi:transcriptional regulator with XRE-family HTH domain
MTADEFRAIRETRYVKRMVMADALGIHESTVGGYERGKHPIPERIVDKLRGVGSPCPKCGSTIAMLWHDGLCGACTQPLPEDA